MVKLCSYSQDIEAKHKSGETYRYVIGVCVDVGDVEKHRDCAIMQYGANFSHCLGKLTNIQTSQSKTSDLGLVIIILVSFGVAKDGVWKELTYTRGSRYSSHCNRTERMSRIVFLCDPAVTGKVGV